MDKRPIGVFDSGLGGLTVVKEIKKILPNEKIIYLGDTARVPYGTRSKDTITKFAKEDINFLLSKNVKCVVIACNSVSSVASGYLKKAYSVPIFDVITPTCKFVAEIKKVKRIGIIGTPATIKSNAYVKGIKKYNSKVKIFQNASPLLVPVIEENEIKSGFTLDITKKYLNPLIKNKIDLLILGCTHYPLIMPLITKILGKNCEIVNPAKYLSEDLFNHLKSKNLLSNDKVKFVDKYFVTDLTEGFVKQFGIFLGNVNKVNLSKLSLINNEK